MTAPVAVDLSALAGRVLFKAMLEGEPLPWPRARTGQQGQHYLPRAFSAHRDALAWKMREALIEDGSIFTGDVGLLLGFFRSTRRRVDIDNLLKAVMDAGNGTTWADDSQIVHIVANIRVEPAAPRTEIVAYRI